MLQNIDPLSAGILFKNRYRIVRCIKGGPPSAVYEVVDEKRNACCLLEVPASDGVTTDDVGDTSEIESGISWLFDGEQNIKILEPGIDEEMGRPFFALERFADDSEEIEIEACKMFAADKTMDVVTSSPARVVPLPIPLPPIPPPLATKPVLPPPPPLMPTPLPPIPPPLATKSVRPPPLPFRAKPPLPVTPPLATKSVRPPPLPVTPPLAMKTVRPPPLPVTSPLAAISLPPPNPPPTRQSPPGLLPPFNPLPKFPQMKGEATPIGVPRLPPAHDWFVSPPHGDETPFWGGIATAAQVEILRSAPTSYRWSDRFRRHRGIAITLTIVIGLVAIGLLGLWVQQKRDVPDDDINRVKDAHETTKVENVAPASIPTSVPDPASSSTAAPTAGEKPHTTRATATKPPYKASPLPKRIPSAEPKTKPPREGLY